MLRCSALEQKRPGYLKACKRCFREFEEFEADVLDVSPATELADYLDSRLHGNDKQGCGNNRGRRTSVLRMSMIFAPSAGKSWV